MTTIDKKMIIWYKMADCISTSKRTIGGPLNVQIRCLWDVWTYTRSKDARFSVPNAQKGLKRPLGA